MLQYIRDEIAVFKRYTPLLLNLVRRDIAVKYRRSILGVAWSFLNPLLMMLVQTMVFSTLFKSMLPSEHFPVYLLSAQVLFNFFSDSTQLGLESVLGGAGLLKKVYIPKYIFPLEKVIFSMVNFGFSLLALLLVVVVTKVGLTLWLLLLPVVIVIMFVFNLGISLILASFTVFFRDIKHFYGVLVLALNYLTPLFYVKEAIASVWVQRIIEVNPLYWFVTISRDLVLYQQMPVAFAWVYTSLWAIVMLVAGLLIFKKTQDKFILHI